MKKILAILVIIAVAVASAQSTKSSTTLDAASCFAIKGINSLQVERVGEKDYLILRTGMEFINFTDKVLGADKKQDICLKDLKVTVYLKDMTEKVEKTETINEEDGVIEINDEDVREIIGKLNIKKDFIIGKDGLKTVLPIAMNRITLDAEKKEINNPAFETFMRFFNLMNADLAVREKYRIVFKGTCQVAVKGENTAWLWASSPINYEWKLKPTNDNKYLLQIEE